MPDGLAIDEVADLRGLEGTAKHGRIQARLVIELVVDGNDQLQLAQPRHVYTVRAVVGAKEGFIAAG
ncbi:MAG: hypothetical protein U5L98_16570 [Halomonas sp.]|uniref:hypothetical protein n=1 Tax=Halomonas sp. TaxID=1486246 RepID=UPI002ACDB0A6|nr:hypothetical protein [Halomonas sp.]MDZ7854197.1 hypothetical protein [Halomonas sp.]